MLSLQNFKKIPVRWSAPEVILSSRRHARSDVWSFGVLLWEIFSFGETPYGYIDSEEAVGNYVSIEGGRLCRPSISVDDDDLYKLMTSCWSTSVEQRPGFQALVEGLRLATKEKIDSRISLDSDLTDKSVSSQVYTLIAQFKNVLNGLTFKTIYLFNSRIFQWIHSWDRRIIHFIQPGIYP